MPIPIFTSSVIKISPQAAKRLKEIENMDVNLPPQNEVDEYTIRSLLALVMIKYAPREIVAESLPARAKK